MRMCARKELVCLLLIIVSFTAQAQGCCSGGGGSPLADGAASGVLPAGQMEFLATYKHTGSNRFMSGDRDTIPFFESLRSNYLFLKADYGVSDRFTFSVSVGYYLNRTITEFPDTSYANGAMLVERHKVESKGFGDLILFPRYNVLRTKGSRPVELNLGLGLKIPIGQSNDSSFIGYAYYINYQQNPPVLDSNQIWQTSPPTVQATTGSNDILFNLFFMQRYHRAKLRFLVNYTYMHKGWNQLGIKFGDYSSLGLSLGTTVFKSLGILAQFRGEYISPIRTHADIDVLSLYNIDPESTGSWKLSFVPQLTYAFKRPEIQLFATADFPLYQYLHGTQIASRWDVTCGVAYRFSLRKKKEAQPDKEEMPLAYTEEKFRVWGKCDMCKNTIEKTLLGMKGVHFAQWDQSTQQVVVRYQKDMSSVEDLKIALAKVGYDTDTHKASDKAYNNLHSCCKYERE